MQLPAKNWPMRWLRDFLCESREGILHSAAETAQPTGAKIAISKKIYPMHEKPKRDNIMRIAVTYENGEIFQHFGHTEQFKIYDVEDRKSFRLRLWMLAAADMVHWQAS